jgi:CHAT domain-containing protein
VDEDKPELSQIFLVKDSLDDGNLFVGEIYNLHFKADLIALSACQTGLGKITKGEGMVGLSRALLYGGSRNLMVSLWNVADQSTAQMMTDFYRIVLQTPAEVTFTQALREAKLKTLSSAYASPYYWAAFVLIGK